MVKTIYEKEWTKEVSFEEVLVIYNPMLLKIAGSFSKTYEQEFEDMMQTAKMFLWSAFLRYKPELKIGFGYYAKRTITHKLLTYFRDNSRSVKHSSLNINISNCDSEVELIDILSDEKDVISDVIQKCDLWRVLDGLSSRRKSILEDYYYRNKNQREIAEKLHMSQMNVSRELRLAIDYLRKNYKAG